MNFEPGEQIFSRIIAETPVGPLTVFVVKAGLLAIEFAAVVEIPSGNTSSRAVLDAAELQLNEYFSGRRKVFDLPIDWSGFSEYQEKVLRACYAIPYGEVCSYGQLAERTGRPHAARAVGGFMASNPIPLVIPCHRVVGTDRRLHGYGAPGGLDSKAYLLTLEGHRVVNQKLA